MTFKPLLSSITKKLIMAITGAGFVFFLTFHGVMNFISIFSTEAYEGICNFLGANWYAIAATIALGGLAGLHILLGIILSFENFIARGFVRYRRKSRPNNVEWSSRNMLLLGILVLLGLGLHLYNFWYRMQFAELMGRAPVNGAEQLQFVFSHTPYSISYLVWLAALWLHLSHGIWSLLQSIGWNSDRWKRTWQIIGKTAATLIVLLFVAVVVNFWLINPL